MTANRVFLRPLIATDLEAINQLIIESKAHWGYDAAFIDDCRDVLTITHADLDARHMHTVGLFTANAPVGALHIIVEQQTAVLDKLFVQPSAIGSGFGKQLYEHAIDIATTAGAERMTIDADPYAADFYRYCGAIQTGFVASTVTPGRKLPLFEVALNGE